MNLLRLVAMKRLNPKFGHRKGSATLEFAVCLPILIMIVLGTVEACGMIYLKQTLCVAAYEGARGSVIPGATKSDIVQRCHTILSQRQVTGATIVVSPDDFESQPSQSWITVRITARASDNAYIGSVYSRAMVIGAEATMMKEYD